MSATSSHEPRPRPICGERPGWGEAFGDCESRHLVAYEHALMPAAGGADLVAFCRS